MTSPEEFTRLQSAMDRAVKTHWKAFLFEGILLMVLGVAALVLPPLASLATAIFLGWMFLIGGIGGLIATYWASSSRPVSTASAAETSDHQKPGVLRAQ